MNSDNWELLELAVKGYCCSQIMAARALQIMDEENPALILAMKALCGGLHDGSTCGALSGGACFLMLLHENSGAEMIRELNAWFLDEYGSTDCDVLTKGREPLAKSEICPSIISSVYDKCLDLLEKHDYFSD